MRDAKNLLQYMFNSLRDSRVDYVITSLKILQSLKESVIPPDGNTLLYEGYPKNQLQHNFSQEELVNWDQYSFALAMGLAAVEFLTLGMEGYINQAKRVEELFGKICPPPNV